MKKLLLLTILALFVFSSLVLADDRGFERPELLVSVDELKAELNDDDLVIIDVRDVKKYILSHIPGAVQMHGSDIATTENGVKGVIAKPEDFAKVLGSKGVSNDSKVVVYDDAGGLWAARVWWILNVYGHENVRLLDGGLGAWKEAGYDTDMFAAKVEEANYEITEVNEELIVDTDTVAANLNNPEFVVVDTRSDAEYSGEKTFGGAPRKGHIPGAVHIEWVNNLDDNGLIKPASELEELYVSNGITRDLEVIAPHCHSAVRSAHTMFVLTLLGYDNVKNYDESWIGWSNREDLPVE